MVKLVAWFLESCEIVVYHPLHIKYKKDKKTVYVIVMTEMRAICMYCTPLLVKEYQGQYAKKPPSRRVSRHLSVGNIIKDF